ncbi:MAG: hypothetical protein K0S33_2022 [Bacteroidetes bacterium]|jgi:hypothetical protein|nr:hypothetical protein [Bacteroidota bacterium]
MELSATELEMLKYPIGKSPAKADFSFEEISTNISRIAELPVALMKLSAELKKEDYDVSYRPGGWSIAQIIHHITDSHVNAYTRVKLTLTENNPTIKPYDENLWAITPDATSGDDTHVSVIILSGIHHRLAKLLSSLEESAFKKTYIHPQYIKTVNLAQLCDLYAWHGEHHVAQIKVALEKRF